MDLNHVLSQKIESLFLFCDKNVKRLIVLWK